MSKALPLSTLPEVAFIMADVDTRARTLFAKIVEQAENGDDQLDANVRAWIKQGKTVLLRDEICFGFKGMFRDDQRRIVELDWFNAFADLDSARAHLPPHVST